MLAERVIEWTQQWKGEGRQEGKAQFLQEQLTARFGPLPDWAVTRLQQSSETELGRWCLRVLNYSSLQEILN